MAWVDLRDAIPGLRGGLVHVAAAAREPEVRAALTSEGFVIHTLTGSVISSEAAFFAEAARAFGFPEWFGANWDALHDSLGEATSDGALRQAVVWTDADRSLALDAHTVLTAVLALEAAARSAAGEDGARQLEVFLFGSSGGFGAA